MCISSADSMERPFWGIERHSTRGHRLHLIREQVYKNRNLICDKFRHIQSKREGEMKKRGTDRVQWNCTLLYSTWKYFHVHRLMSRINALFWSLPAICAHCGKIYHTGNCLVLWCRLGLPLMFDTTYMYTNFPLYTKTSTQAQEHTCDLLLTSDHQMQLSDSCQIWFW